MADLFTEIIKKFSNYDDPAGVASASPGTKTVKAALDQTDPQRKSQVLPQFATQVQQIINMMGIISMGGAATSPASTQQYSNNIANSIIVAANLYSNSTSNSLAVADPTSYTANAFLSNRITDRVSEIIQIGLANALAIESQNKGLFKTMGVMASVLNKPYYFSLLSKDYQSIVSNAISQFETNIFKYGLTNYPVLKVPPIIVGNNIPSPIVTSVPDFYAQVFYHENVDPYPGYVCYTSISDFTDNVYTIRTSDNPPFYEASDLFIYTAEQSFLLDLDPYVSSANLSISSLAFIITDAINKTLTVWHNTTLGAGSQNQVLISNTVSNSSSSSSGGNIVAMLLPWLNSMMQGAQSNHLPKSVLNQGAIQQLLNKHGDMCAKMKMCQQYGQQAISPGNAGNGPTSSYSQ
jgi:hypothetical protein